MNSLVKVQIQFFSTLLLATMAIVLFGVAIAVNQQVQVVVAQAAVQTAIKEVVATVTTTPQLRPAQVENGVDLTISQQTSAISVPSGSAVTYTIFVQNSGDAVAEGVIFKNKPPKELLSPKHDFDPSVKAIPYGDAANMEWLFLQPIAVNSSLVVTVTGRLTSFRTITAVNWANVRTVNPSDEFIVDNNTSEKGIGVAGYGPAGSGLVYLPVIRRDPTPTPTQTPTITPSPTPTNTPTQTPTVSYLYYDDFSYSSSGWYVGEDNNGYCDSQYNGGRYQIAVDKGKRVCWRPAPSANESKWSKYDSFQVDVYHSEGESNASYALYINGRGGGEYYLLRVYPNTSSCDSDEGGSWEFWRTFNNSSELKKSEQCNSIIKRGIGSGATNVLRLKHSSDKYIAIYINGKLLASYKDDSELTGKGTGLYSRSADEKDVLIKFDNFTVSPP